MSDFMSHYLVPARHRGGDRIGAGAHDAAVRPIARRKLMRLRVLLQFVAIIVIMATIWGYGPLAQERTRASLHGRCAHVLNFLFGPSAFFFFVAAE